MSYYCRLILYLVYGKAEGPGEKWHGHVTAITVGPEFRRYGVARKLMNLCELVSEKMCVHYCDINDVHAA